jgi:hypothetical protein
MSLMPSSVLLDNMVYYVQHYLTADNPIQEGRIVVRYN